MKIDRRKFLTFAGATTALAFLGKHSFEAVAENQAHFEALNSTETKRYAMVIDLKKCVEHENCNKCIEACHKVHNVPKINNPKDEIKWIWKEFYQNAFVEQENERLPREILDKKVLLLCNHCDNPPCTKVCPTKATWKREDGIVMMDWHRCIGCRYCVAACPYGSRSFNWIEPREHLEVMNPDFPTRTRGVVEKCTFCDERLARGLLPACVISCPYNALYFGDLKDENSEVTKILATNFSLRRKAELGTHPEIYYLI